MGDVYEHAGHAIVFMNRVYLGDCDIGKLLTTYRGANHEHLPYFQTQAHALVCWFTLLHFCSVSVFSGTSRKGGRITAAFHDVELYVVWRGSFVFCVTHTAEWDAASTWWLACGLGVGSG